MKKAEEERNSRGHKDAGKAATSRWNQDMAKMDAMFDGSFIDPFNLESPPENLVNISTGTIPPSNVAASMLSSLDTGMSLAMKFGRERLIIPEGQDKAAKNLYDPISKS